MGTNRDITILHGERDSCTKVKKKTKYRIMINNQINQAPEESASEKN